MVTGKDTEQLNLVLSHITGREFAFQALLSTLVARAAVNDVDPIGCLNRIQSATLESAKLVSFPPGTPADFAERAQAVMDQTLENFFTCVSEDLAAMRTTGNDEIFK